MNTIISRFLAMLKTDKFWLLAGLSVFVVAFTPIPQEINSPTNKVIQVKASSFEFSPGVVQVNPGDRVTIELTSTDVVHGLYIDGYEVDVSADPGQTASVTFVADKSGTFRFRCSITCGDLHPFMIGKLKVGSNLFLWRATGIVILLAGLGAWGSRSE